MILGMAGWIFWLILFVVFLVAEAATLNLVSIWFAAGCLVALMLDVLGFSVWVQVGAMVVVSLFTFVLFMLVIKPRMGIGPKTPVATNADRIVGEEGLVIEAIDPIQGSGQIKVRGQVWSASSINQEPIAVDSLVTVVELRGVKAIVKVR